MLHNNVVPSSSNFMTFKDSQSEIRITTRGGAFQAIEPDGGQLYKATGYAQLESYCNVIMAAGDGGTITVPEGTFNIPQVQSMISRMKKDYDYTLTVSGKDIVVTA